ncbi:MAG TPA: cytochrome c biogenesis protein CcdA, partial [Planctomycetota bacterium]|nr:cytochrome c biogenesis protein CcdA [Planctomycetota bacterium]
AAAATLTFEVSGGAPVAIPPGPPKAVELPAEPVPPDPVAAAPLPDDENPFLNVNTGFLILILLGIGGGLFALAMPCTYPMIPITITFFTKQAEARQGRVLPLALAYGAGIVLIFNVIGWVFAASIQKFAADPWLNLVFGLAFIAFALSLFGLYELRLPSFVNQVASRASGASGYVGVFLLGVTVVVTSFTCTAPILGSLLTAVSKGGSLWRTTVGMTAFGATVAAPFILLALFPGRVRSLPRAGEWMHTLKVTFGFIELAAALKFLSNTDLGKGYGVLPRELFLLLWAGISLVTGLYVLGLFRMKEESGGGIGGIRLLAGLAAVTGALYFFSGAMGYRLDWISESLAPPYHAERIGAAGGGAAPGEKAAWTIVEDDLEGGLARARDEGKLALVNFTGVVCNNCRDMEVNIFPKLSADLRRYVEVRLHTDKAKDAAQEARSNSFQEYEKRLTGSQGNPIYAIVDPEAPEKLIAKYEGSDISRGKEFGDFLRKHAR